MDKKSLTTGEVAKLCDVSIPTIHKWIREERIKFFKMPGSGKLRIPRDEVYRFMEEYGFPFDKEQSKTAVLIVANPDSHSKKFASSLHQDEDREFHIANDVLTGGIMATKTQPTIVLVDLTLPGVDPQLVAQSMQHAVDNERLHLIALSSNLSATTKKQLKKHGFEDFLELPLKVAAVRKKVATLLKKDKK